MKGAAYGEHLLPAAGQAVVHLGEHGEQVETSARVSRTADFHGRM